VNEPVPSVTTASSVPSMPGRDADRLLNAAGTITLTRLQKPQLSLVVSPL
jgi:hypothetical protein